MKTLFSRPPGRITAILVVLTLAFMNADAQYKGNRFRKPNFYIGVEGAMGTRTFSIKSDIAAINGMKALEEGYSLGAVLGGRTLLTKVKTGFFKPSSEIGEQVNARNLELSFNAFPLELFGTRNQFFKPYLVVGVDRSQLKFLGNYSLPALPTPPLPAPAENPCPCVCPGAEEIIPVPESPPATTTSTENLPENTELGTVNVIWGSVGTGLIIHVPGKITFLNFFMEAQYGMPLSTRATSPAFDRTTPSKQLSLSAGIAIGISR